MFLVIPEKIPRIVIIIIFFEGSLFNLERYVWLRIRFKLERPVEEALCLAEMLGYVNYTSYFNFYMPIATRGCTFFP